MSNRSIHATLDLLDRQIVDCDDELVGKVDDVEFREIDGGRLQLSALLLGPQAYASRLGGRLGSWIAAVGARMAGTTEPIRIPIEWVDEIGTSIKLGVSIDQVERTERADKWLREHLVDRIPGAKRASD